MPEIVWCGPGWYKLLHFAVGNSKVVQVSQNKWADIEDSCIWFDKLEAANKHFGPKQVVKSEREVY